MSYHSFFQHNACGLLICKNDPYSTIIEANDAFYRMVGYTREEMKLIHQDRFANLVFDDLSEILEKVFNAVGNEKTLDYEFRILNKNGQILWIHDIATYDEENDVFHVVIMDISYRQEALEAISQSASIDGLTGLLNRDYLEKQVKQMALFSPCFTHHAMFLIDLDNFKMVNDTYGHLVGDKLLSKVGKRLRSLFVDDEILGRLGGDEFAVFTRDVDSIEGLKAIAHSIVESLVFDICGINVSASVGVYFDSQHQLDFTRMYFAADKALYCVKNSGKNGYQIFDDNDLIALTLNL